MTAATESKPPPTVEVSPSSFLLALLEAVVYYVYLRAAISRQNTLRPPCADPFIIAPCSHAHMTGRSAHQNLGLCALLNSAAWALWCDLVLAIMRSALVHAATRLRDAAVLFAVHVLTLST